MNPSPLVGTSVVRGSSENVLHSFLTHRRCWWRLTLSGTTASLTRFPSRPQRHATRPPVDKGTAINRRVAAFVAVGTNYMPTFILTPFAYISLECKDFSFFFFLYIGNISHFPRHFPHSSPSFAHLFSFIFIKLKIIAREQQVYLTSKERESLLVSAIIILFF